MSFCFFCWDPTRTVDPLSADGKDPELAAQDAKVLYYSPSYATQEEVRNQVALVQGLVDFTQQWDNFTPMGQLLDDLETIDGVQRERPPACAPTPASSSSSSRTSRGAASGAPTAKKQKQHSALKSMKTKQYSFAFDEVEENVWFALVVKHPVVDKGASGNGGGGSSDEGGAGAGGEDNFEYLETVMQESTLAAILKNLYAIFHLLHGPVRCMLADNRSRELLADLFEDLVPAFLETVGAHLLDSNHANGVFYQLEGFHYGPVERNTYVTIGTFLAKLKENIPFRNAALFYKAHLIYSGMGLEDMKVLYSYLVNLFNGKVANGKLNLPPYGRIPTAGGQQTSSSSFGRSHLVDDDKIAPGERNLFGGPSGATTSRAAGAGGASSSRHHRGATPQTRGQTAQYPGSYLFGTDSNSTVGKNMFIPRVFLQDGSEGQLVALCYKGVLMVLIFDLAINVDARLLDQVKMYATSEEGMVENLSTLVPIIDRQFSLVMSTEDEYKFLYFNHANQALRVSNHFTANGAAEMRGRGGAPKNTGAGGGYSMFAGGAAGGISLGSGVVGAAGSGAAASAGNKQAAAAGSSTSRSIYNFFGGGGSAATSGATGRSGGAGFPGGAGASTIGTPQQQSSDTTEEGGRLTISQVSSASTMDFLANGDKDLFLAQTLHSTIAKGSDSNYREVCLKEADRGWICAKRSLEREFYLMLDQPSMMLSKCQEESARFSAIHFSNIYMM